MSAFVTAGRIHRVSSRERFMHMKRQQEELIAGISIKIKSTGCHVFKMRMEVLALLLLMAHLPTIRFLRVFRMITEIAKMNAIELTLSADYAKII